MSVPLGADPPSSTTARASASNAAPPTDDFAKQLPPKLMPSRPRKLSSSIDDAASASSTSPQLHLQSPPKHLAGSPLAGHQPPPPKNKSTNAAGGGGGGRNMSLTLVIGAASAVLLFLLVALMVYLWSGRRKRRTRDGLNYYTDPSSGSSKHRKGGKNYYNNGSAPPWRPSLDHIVKLPPPADSSVAVGPWRAPPPPPPPPPTFLLYSSSDDMSTNIFSGPPMPPPSPMISIGFNKSVFTYDELAVATGGFSHANLLGQGGFGYVHKGVLPNGKEVAVKSLKAGSGQGEREFQAEVEIISRVHHRHLVSLVGYCIAGGQRMLVYEFVPNKTLEYHLYTRDRPPMDFATRLKIALGAAKGIAYLHEDCHPKIIHRDIKAANILLDNNFEAMVADFGLAKLCTDNYTHISTRVMGTFGYLAPEYASSGKLTEKSDVFSFGIMLLELITGRRPADTTRSMMEDTLVDWARPLLTRALSEGIFDSLVDPRLDGHFNPNEMIRMVACATASVRTSGRRRPKMIQMVRILESETSLEDLNEVLIKPGLNTMLSFDSSDESSSQKSLPRRF